MQPPPLVELFHRWDHRIAGWMRERGPRLLRFALALVFVWFGLLKIFHASPEAELVRRTVYWFPPDIIIPLLGGWEVLIGLCLLWRPLLRLGILLLALQLPGTFLPLVMLPEICFHRAPFALTLEGQYIVKNLLLLGAALVVGGTVQPVAAASRSTPRP